ncbi:MAG TPA: hypothetical protein VGB52_11875 [Actinomycetota bacterium]
MNAASHPIGTGLHALSVIPITQTALWLLYLSGGTLYQMRFPWALLGAIASIAYLIGLVAWLRRRWLRAGTMFAISLIGPMWLWPPSLLVPAAASVIAFALTTRATHLERSTLRRGP